MKSTRFNPPIEWNPTIMGHQKTRMNRYFFGLVQLIEGVSNFLSVPYRPQQMDEVLFWPIKHLK